MGAVVHTCDPSIRKTKAAGLGQPGLLARQRRGMQFIRRPLAAGPTARGKKGREEGVEGKRKRGGKKEIGREEPPCTPPVLFPG